MIECQPSKSDDVMTRLRWWAFKFCGKGERENLASDTMSDALHYIEKLEAALREITESARLVGDYHHVKIARKALEEKDG
jgi:hypothetical protein